MRERRFYYSGMLEGGAEFFLVGEEFNHVRVLRLSKGARITVFDGHKNEADAVIVEIARDRAKIKIEKVSKSEKKSPHVILAVSPIKASRMDFLLEKTCELGVDEVWPIICERTVVKIGQEEKKSKGARWEKILISAAKQSGRADIPHIAEASQIQKILERLRPDDLLILCDKDGARPCEIVLGQVKRVVIFVGPEGDFTEPEKRYFVGLGAKAMALSGNVLRTETACIAALTIINCLLSRGG